MSDGLLDERVVEMRFDNADFERNVNQSIKTIDKLKESLDFENAGESFENISAAAAKCDMKPLEDSLEGITVKFNMLEMVAANVLGNITNKIVDAGARMAKSLTVDQLTAGWAKYDQKTAAVQTIISATGASIDEVNQKLEKLIWFADETSYDFVDMVNNIGKFTSAGVDLDTAVDSMMGISNWAAASGAGIQQASRAMYNLSQAIGMGYVGLTDWRSIELANMATKEFKETVIATALDMGTLQQAADGTVKTLSGKFEVTAENMRNSLKEQWFSTDVLNSALATYNEFANLVHDRQEQWAEENNGAYLTVSRTIKLLESEGYAMDTIGAKAFMRAQEATKFSEAVAATADAVSSGWMRTFEIIFGNYEQAKKLWTDLANDMYDVFASGGERRNDMLSDVMQSNYQKMLNEMPDGNEMNARLYDKLYEMTKNNLGVDTAEELFSAYTSLEDLLKDNADYIYNSSLEDAFKQVAVDFDREADAAQKLSKQLKAGTVSLKQTVLRLVGGQFGNEIETQKKEVEKLGYNYEMLSQLAEEYKAGFEIPWDQYQSDFVEYLDEQYSSYKTFVKKITELLPEEGFFGSLTEFGGRDKLIGGFQNLIDTFKNLYLTIVEIGNGISDLTGSGSFLEKLINGFSFFTNVLNYSDKEFESVQEGIYNFFHGGLQSKWNRFWHGYDVKDVLENNKAAFSGFWGEIEKAHVPGMLDHIFSIYKDHLAVLPANVSQTIEKVRIELSTFFGSIPQKINEIKEKIFGKFEIHEVRSLFSNNIDTVITHTGGLLNDLKDRIRSFGNGLGGKIFDGLLITIKKVADFMFGYQKEDGTPIEGAFIRIYDKATAFWERLKDIGKIFNSFSGVKNIFNSFGKLLSPVTSFLGLGSLPIEDIDEETKSLKTHIDTTSKVVEKFSSSLAYLPNLISNLFKNLKGLLIDPFTNFGKLLSSDVFGPLFDNINTLLHKFGAGRIDLHTLLFGGEDQLTKKEIKGVFSLLNPKNIALDIFETLKESLSSIPILLEDVGLSFSTLYTSLKENGVKAFLFGKDVVKEDINDLDDSVYTYEEHIDGLFDLIKKKINEIPNSFSNFISSIKEKLFGKDVHLLYGNLFSKEIFDEFTGEKLGMAPFFTDLADHVDGWIDTVFGGKLSGIAETVRHYKENILNVLLAPLGFPATASIFAPKTQDRVDQYFVEHYEELYAKGIETYEDYLDALNDYGSTSELYADVNEYVFSKPLMSFKEFLSTVIETIKVYVDLLKYGFTGDISYLLSANQSMSDILGEADVSESIFIKIGQTIKLIKEYAEKIATSIKTIAVGAFNAFNSFRKWLGFDWEFTDEGLVRIPGVIDSIKAKCDVFVSSESFKAIKRFIFGEKDSEGNVIQKNIFGKFGSAIESLSNVFSKVWKSVVSFKDNLFKKDKKSIFESLWDFITGPAKFLQGIKKTAKIIVESLLGISVILMATSIRLGGFEISSPFENLAGTIKDFAISVAIIAAVLVGIPALVSKLNIGAGALALTAVAIGLIMAALVACGQALEGKDEKTSLQDILMEHVNTVPMLKTLAGILLELASIAVVFTLLAKFAGINEVLTGAGAVGIIMAGVGACLALIHLPEIIHGSKAAKSRAGEMFGISAVLWMLGNLLIKMATAIGIIALTASKIGKDKDSLTNFYVLLASVFGSIFGILALLKSFSDKGINAGVVLSLGIIHLLIGQLSTTISVLAILNNKVDGMNVVGGVLEIYAVFMAIAIMMDFLSKRKFDKSVEITLGIIGGLIFVLGHVLDIISKTIEKVGAINSLVAFVEIIGSLYTVIGAIAWLSKIDVNTKTVINFGIMAGIITILGGIILGFTKLSDMLGVKFDPKQVLNMILSIGEVVLAIVGLSIIFGLLGKVAEGLNSGFGALAGLIAKTVGIVALVMVLVGIIGGIAKAIDSKLGDGASLDAINYFGDLLESLFNALGKAVGAVIGGFGEGVTDSLSKIGQNITDFITNLDPFIEKVGSLEEKHLAGAGIFTGILLAVAADTVIANITALAGLFGSISAFIIGTNMSNLITNLQPFLTEVVKLDESHVKGTGYFTRILINVGFQSVIAAFTSIAGMFATASPLTVGMNISNLITKMEPFITAVKDINESHVKGAGYFTDLLIAVGKQMLISSVENLISLFGGSRAFSQMFSKLNNEVVPGIKTFSNGISGVTLDKVEKASKVLPAIFDMLTDDHYRTGGLSGIWDWITKGDTDYTAMFSALNEKILPGLRAFASGVNQLDDAGKEMDYSHVSEAAKAIKSVMDIMVISTKGMISEDDASNGIFGLFAKASSADQLKSSFDAITNTVVPAIFALQKALQTVSEDGSEIDPEYIQKVIGSFAGLLQAITDFRDVGLSEEEVGQIGSYIITGLVNALDEGTIYVKEAAQRVAKGLVEGLTLTLEVHSPSKVAYEIGAFVAEGLTNGLRAGEGMTWAMARAFGKGTINALEDGLANFDSVSQHAINMVTADLLDENRFDMKDFVTGLNRFGNEEIDFDRMRKFLTDNFSGIFDQNMIDGFVNSYEQTMNKLNDTINDKDYAELMTGIAAGDFGLSENTIIDALTEELGDVKAARQAWEDYNDVKEGNLKINQELFKQQKQNPPMTLEQYMDMIAHEEEGYQRALKGEFDELARLNDTTRAQEMEKAGFNAELLQGRLNEGGLSQEQIEAYIKDKALKDYEAEQTRLVDNIIRNNETVAESTTEVAEALNFDIDDPLGEKLAIKDAAALKEVAGAAEEVAEAQQSVTETAEAKAEAVEAETAAVEASNNANKEAAKINRDGAVFKSLDKVELGQALEAFREGKKLTEEQTRIIENARQATIKEGAFGVGIGEEGWADQMKKWGLTETNAKYLAHFAHFYNPATQSLEEYVKWVEKSDEVTENLTKSTENAGESAKKTGTSLANIADDGKAVVDIFKHAFSTDAYDEKTGSFSIDFEKAYQDSIADAEKAGDETRKKYLESFYSGLGEEGFNKVGDKGKIELKAEDVFKLVGTEGGIKGFAAAKGGELLGNLIGENIPFLGDIFGNTKEFDFTQIFSGTDSTMSFFKGLVASVTGLNKELDETSDKKVDIDVNDSKVESAISMADELKKKYTLGDDEKKLAAEGIKDLQNGVKVTEKSADAIQKLWDGAMIGMYESGEERITAIKQLLNLDNFDWETLSSLLDENGNFDITKQTSTALDQANKVIQMATNGEAYSTADLMSDIYAGKWGYDTDRLKALEKAGYDAQKVQENFLKWYNGDKTIENLGDDYFKVSESEKAAAEQAEKMNAVLNQTPEGAFRSVADFLDGVNKAVENSETADKFKQLMTDIADSMKSLSLSDASNFEKVAGFLTAVRTSAKESSTIAQDFKAFVDGIKDSIIKLGDIDIKNPEGMEKVKNFLNSIKIENKDTLDSVSSFIGNIVEFATGANAGGDYSTKLVESIDSLMTSINGIELNPDATTPVVEFLDQLTNAAGILSGSSEGVVQTFISNIYSALENTTDKAASAADTIAQVIVDTLASYYSQLATIGHNFVWWLARGILKARNLATDAGESVAGALMNSLKDYAVSKAQKSGGDFVSNFVTGMNSPESQKLLQRSLDNLFNPKTEVEDLPSGADALAEKLAMKNGKEAPESEKTEPQKETGPSAGTKYGQQFVQDMSAAIEQGAGTVGGTLTTLGENISASFSIDVTGIADTAKEYIANLANGLQEGFDAEKELLGKVTGKIRATISSTVPDGYNLGYNFMINLRRGMIDGAAAAGFGAYGVGQNVGIGLANGVTAGGKSAKEAINSITDNVVRAGAQGLGVESPSKIFYQFGKYVDEGLANGIRDYTNLAVNQSDGMAEVVTGVFSDAISAIADDLDTNMNLNPVIRPVIDMSDVYDSASTIDAMLSSDKAMSISAAENAKTLQSTDDMSEVTPGTQVFNQYNYSPKALSRLEIYRQTRNQFAMIKGVNQRV